MFILIYICIKLNMSSYYPQLLILYIVDPSDFHGLYVNSHSTSKKKKKKNNKKQNLKLWSSHLPFIYLIIQ